VRFHYLNFSVGTIFRQRTLRTIFLKEHELQKGMYSRFLVWNLFLPPFFGFKTRVFKQEQQNCFQDLHYAFTKD
jgi:hypothetical protein